ncbi:MAG: peptide chain release factor H [Sphingomonas bacterium]
MSEIILHLSSGQGPEECQWVVAQLATAFAREATAHGLACEPIEPVTGSSSSALLHVVGNGSEAFAAARTGTIRWIGTSPFRPTHKRKNWFVAVSKAPEVESVAEFFDADVQYQAFRSSGPGGQHVNRTDSAVRATHIPTGLAAVSQDQRSQFANKKIARLKLAMVFDERRRQGNADSKRALWNRNHELERGNAVRIYEGPGFRLRAPGAP